MTDTTDIEARLRETAAFGETHVDGLMIEAADTIAALRDGLRDHRGAFDQIAKGHWHSDKIATAALTKIDQLLGGQHGQ